MPCRDDGDDADRIGALAPAGEVHGRVQAVRIEPLAGSPSLECTLVDDTGGVSVVFFGRRHIEGVEIGAMLTATGMAIEHKRPPRHREPGLRAEVARAPRVRRKSAQRANERARR